MDANFTTIRVFVNDECKLCTSYYSELSHYANTHKNVILLKHHFTELRDFYNGIIRGLPFTLIEFDSRTIPVTGKVSITTIESLTEKIKENGRT